MIASEMRGACSASTFRRTLCKINNYYLFVCLNLKLSLKPKYILIIIICTPQILGKGRFFYNFNFSQNTLKDEYNYLLS
jgi:hypothetical protein